MADPSSADTPKTAPLAEELIQAARNNPKTARTLLEGYLPTLTTDLANLEGQLRSSEYRVHTLLNKRTTILSHLVEVQMLLNNSEHQ